MGTAELSCPCEPEHNHRLAPSSRSHQGLIKMAALLTAVSNNFVEKIQDGAISIPSLTGTLQPR